MTDAIEDAGDDRFVDGELARKRSQVRVSVKEMGPKAKEPLTGKGHAEKALEDQALAGWMKPNLVRAFIQRGALR